MKFKLYIYIDILLHERWTCGINDNLCQLLKSSLKSPWLLSTLLRFENHRTKSFIKPLCDYDQVCMRKRNNRLYDMAGSNYLYMSNDIWYAANNSLKISLDILQLQYVYDNQRKFHCGNSELRKVNILTNQRSLCPVGTCVKRSLSHSHWP